MTTRLKAFILTAKGVSAGLLNATRSPRPLTRFKSSGKWIVAYADSYTQSDYYIASIADELYLNPVGMVDIHGLSATTMFYKGLLDKAGIEMQIIKVGTFKSAVEPFILTRASEANRLQQRVFLDNIWDCVSNSIASARGVTLDNVNYWADSLLMTFPPDEYLDNSSSMPSIPS